MTSPSARPERRRSAMLAVALIGALAIPVLGAASASAADRESSGTADEQFTAAALASIGGSVKVQALAVQQDGKILVGGDARGSWPGLERLLPNGLEDPDFRVGTGVLGSRGEIYAIVVQPDGKIVIGGVFTTFGSESVNRVVRLLPDGTLDTAFSAAMGVGPSNGRVRALALQPNGEILVGGEFGAFDNDPQKRFLVRLTPQGAVDETFQPGPLNAPVNALDLRYMSVSDYDIVVGGSFSSIGVSPAPKLAVLENDGSLDQQFMAAYGSGAAGDVFAVAVDQQARVIIGGRFSSLQGLPAGHIGRVEASGAPDALFMSTVRTGFTDPSGAVQALAIDSYGGIVAGGMLGEYTGVLDSEGESPVVTGSAVRFQIDGALDRAFTAEYAADGGSGSVIALASEELGAGGERSVIVGGEIGSIQGIAAGGVTRVRDVLREIDPSIPTTPTTPTDPTSPIDPGVPTTPVDPVDPVVSLSKIVGAVGDAVEVSGTGFVPGEPVTVTLFSDPILLAELEADQAGAVRGVVTIPSGVAPGAHRIVLAGTASNRQAEAAIVVVAATTTAAETVGAPRRALASTGPGDMPFLAMLGTLASVAGLLMLTAGRRRRLG